MTNSNGQGQFDPEKLKGMPDLVDDMAEMDESQAEAITTEKLIRHLQAWHRELAEQIVECHRGLARLAVTNKDEEKAALRARVAELQAKRTEIEADLEGESKAALKERQRRNARLHATKQEQPQLFDAISDTPLSSAELATLTPPNTTETGNEKQKRERAKLLPVRHIDRDFFLCDMFDYALKDDGVSMEAPIFTLATKPDVSEWHWESKDGSKTVTVTPSVKGRATQFDKDVLIYVVSQMTEALNRGRSDAKNRTIRFTVYDYLVSTNKPVNGRSYERLSETFERLRGTTLKTNIKTGGAATREIFGLIDRAKIVQKSPGDERMVAVEVTLSEWLFNAVQAHEVLTLHPDYFRLRKPLERRLYELARKHCGHQTMWSIGLELLQDKAGSKCSLREFRRMVREIIEANTLPDYRLILDESDKAIFYTKDTRRLVAGLAKK